MRSIILTKVKYSETSIIVKAYTEELGLVSFMVKGAFNRKSKLNVNYFQPLYLVNITFEYNPRYTLQYIKELTIEHPTPSVISDVKKASIALFTTELLTNLIRESEQNKELFDYIYNSILTLEEKEDHYTSFHLIFALKISQYLGFEPQNNYSERNRYFNLAEGIFVHTQPNHNHYIAPPASKIISQIISLRPNNFDYEIEQSLKTIILDKILDFYALHINSFHPMKSHLILHDIFS